MLKWWLNFNLKFTLYAMMFIAPTVIIIVLYVQIIEYRNMKKFDSANFPIVYVNSQNIHDDRRYYVEDSTFINELKNKSKFKNKNVFYLHPDFNIKYIKKDKIFSKLLIYRVNYMECKYVYVLNSKVYITYAYKIN